MLPVASQHSALAVEVLILAVADLHAARSEAVGKFAAAGRREKEAAARAAAAAAWLESAECARLLDLLEIDSETFRQYCWDLGRYARTAARRLYYMPPRPEGERTESIA
ncbi:hypothetical protein GKIL_0919 [Gloeobacter kilaueensis JS1]|uniref:Uncharacterized protein n=2 Tax=Gloeobacter TaxID=33071 RepID=U5QHL9_GLOK1|nr:hypothetical protein GKIL_0919 [Gloeobacter kilaueensis JS1]